MKKKISNQYFNHLGDKFEEFMSDYDVERRIDLIFNRLLCEKIKKNCPVLEIGSGTGRFSKEIKERGGFVTILDIGSNLVRKTSNQLNIPGVVGDALKLPFSGNSFDMVISSECIEHTPNPVSAIREMCRVCKKGGRICFTTPNALWYPVLQLSQKLGLRDFEGLENWIFPYHAVNVLKQEGMKNISIDGCHLWPFQIKISRNLLKKLDSLGRWLYHLMINFGVVAQKI